MKTDYKEAVQEGLEVDLVLPCLLKAVFGTVRARVSTERPLNSLLLLQ